MLNQIDPVVENSPVPTDNIEDFPSPQKSFLAVSPKKVFSKSYHKSEPSRPLVYGILPLADNAGNASQNDKGGCGDA